MTAPFHIRHRNNPVLKWQHSRLLTVEQLSMLTQAQIELLRPHLTPQQLEYISQREKVTEIHRGVLGPDN